MFKIPTLDGLIGTGAAGATVRLPFHYRLGNSGTLNSQYLYVCTWPAAPFDGNGICGFPSTADAPWLASGAEMQYVATDLGLGNYNAYNWELKAGDAGAGTWDTSAQWAAALAADPAGYGLLHSFTAYGSVGVYYLVDLLAAIHIGYSTPAGSYELHPSTVASFMSRAWYRGSRSVHMLLSGADTGGETDNVLYRTYADMDITAGIYPSGSVQCALGNGSPLNDTAGTLLPGADRKFLSSPFAGRITTQQTSWLTGKYPMVLELPPGVADPRASATGIEPMVISNVGYAAECLYIVDIIATAEVKLAHSPTIVGLSSGLSEVIAPYANLGILFQPATNISAPAQLFGAVKVII